MKLKDTCSLEKKQWQTCCCCSVTQLCPTLCNPMDYSTSGFPVLHHLPSLLKLMSIELVMLSNNLILCHPLLLLPSIFPSISIFSDELALHIMWPKYWSFSLSISPSNEYSWSISFRIDWIDLLAVQGIPKSLFQHHGSKTSNLDKPQFSSVQSLSHVQLFVTPWTAAPQASLSITNSQSIFKFMSTESVKPSNHLILCCPLLLLPSILDGILKSRDITLPTKVHIVKAIFPVVMCMCESWTIKKAECWRTDAFKLWCWRRLLRVLHTARRSNQSITQYIHWKDWCWSSNTLATWCKELTHWKRPWCWERWRAGGEGYERGWDGWMASLTQRTWVWANVEKRWKTGKPGVLQSMGSHRVGHDWSNLAAAAAEQLKNNNDRW